MIWRGKRHKCNIEIWNEMGKLFMLIVAKLRHTTMNQMHIFKEAYTAIKVRNYERKILYASNISHFSSTFLLFDQWFIFSGVASSVILGRLKGGTFFGTIFYCIFA